jgi:hypothetical protein
LTLQHDELRASLELRPTEELLSILRDRDEEEWRPEVFDLVATILAARGVPTAEVTASGRERADTGADPRADDPLVVLGSFDVFEAHAVRMALEAAGIEVWMTGDTSGFQSGQLLRVRAGDEREAREILEAEPDAADLPAQGSVEFMSDARARETIVSTRIESPDCAVRVIRGWKCGSVQDLHNEVGAALQFPDDYDENWGGLRDCLLDLSWMPAASYMVVVLDVSAVLPGDENAAATFLRILAEAVRVWGHPDPRAIVPGRTASFRVVIAGDERAVARARAVLGS